MANTSTQLSKVLSPYTVDKLDKELSRYAPNGAYLAFRDDYRLIEQNSGIVSRQNRDDIEDTMFSPNGVGIPVILDTGLTVSETCVTTCEADANNIDSALVDVTSQCLSFGIKMERSQSDYNAISNQDFILRQLRDAAIASRDLFDQKCIDALEAGKNQQQANAAISMGGYFTDSAADSWIVQDATKEDMYNNVAGQFYQMDFYGQKRVVGDAVHMASVRRQFAQGGANAENLQYQFRNPVLPSINAFEEYNSDFIFYGTNNLVSGAGIKESSFVFPTGSTAIFHSYDRAKYGSGAGTLMYGDTEFGTIVLPGLPDVVWGYKKSYGCENGKDFESWQFETKYAILTPYHTDLAAEIAGINKYEVSVV
jgi:hypothetical protein